MVAGTSGASEPTWQTSLGVTQLDGATLSWELDGYASDEYSPSAPLEVIAQKTDSLASGMLFTSLSLAGVFNMMGEDHASVAYNPDSTNVDTPKTILTAIANATMSCFSHCKSWAIVFDSEDALIDTYIPADYFTVGFNESRLSAFKKALAYTGCKARIENTNGVATIHVFRLSSKQENYITGDDDVAEVGSVLWFAQSFTPTTEQLITSVKLLLYRAGTPGTVTVSIRASDAYGRPTGADLCSGTISGDTLTTDTAGLWYEITFGDGYTLTASTKYTIVVRTVSSSLYWRIDTVATYTGGLTSYSSNSGSSWSYLYQNGDFMFETWSKSINYEYNDEIAAANHNFFDKSVRKRLVIPNKITVSSYPVQGSYTGYATDADSYASLGRYIEEFHYVRPTSNAQCTAIATAMIQNLQTSAEQGHGLAPMNVGQEIFDYVKITDSRANDTRTGNIGYLIRNYNSSRAASLFNFEFRFGDLISTGLAGTQPPSISEGELSIQAVADGLLELWGIFNESVTRKYKVYQDEVIDGIYSKVLATQISAGNLYISEVNTFKTGYDPSVKRRVFTATPTTPYDVGDLWLDATTVKRCTTARASGAYVAGDWTATTLDAITDGTTYGRILLTDISAGHILLSETVGTLDNIDEGVTYGKLLLTDISSGHIKLTSGTVVSGGWYDESGVEIDATHGINIYGTANAFTTRATKAGTIQCYVGADGKIYAGAGAVVLDATGIIIDGQTLILKYGATTEGYLYGTPYGLSISAVSGKNLSIGIGISYTGDGIQIGGGIITAWDNIVPGETDSKDLGDSTLRWRDVYVNGVQLTAGGMVYNSGGNVVVLAPTNKNIYLYPKGLYVLPWSDSTYNLGASNIKWAKIYFNEMPACPVPTSNSALEVIKRIKAPKVMLDNRYGERHYFKDEDFPDEMKTDSKNIDENGVVTTGGREIEFIRTIGILVQAVRELTDKVDILEVKNGHK